MALSEKLGASVVCIGLLVVLAAPVGSQTLSSCEREPWLTPCEPIVMSPEGVQTLRLIGIKEDLIRQLGGISEAAGLVDLFAQADAVLRLPPAQGLRGYRIALNLTNTFFQAADALRPRLQSIGWMAIRRDVEQHLASLAASRQDNSPEGRFFAKLLTTLSVGPPCRVEEHDRRRRAWQSAWDNMTADAAALRRAREERVPIILEYNRDKERLAQREAASRDEAQALHQLHARITNTPAGPEKRRLATEYRRRYSAWHTERAEMERVRATIEQRYRQLETRRVELEQWEQRGHERYNELMAEDEALKALKRENDSSCRPPTSTGGD